MALTAADSVAHPQTNSPTTGVLASPAGTGAAVGGGLPRWLGVAVAELARPLVPSAALPPDEPRWGSPAGLDPGPGRRARHGTRLGKAGGPRPVAAAYGRAFGCGLRPRRQVPI